MNPVFLLVAVVFLSTIGFVAQMMVLARRSQCAPETGLFDGRLRPCPDHRNCACSESCEDARQFIEPISFVGEPKDAWKRAKELVIALGGRIERLDDSYLWATFRTRGFGFVDDLEFRLVAVEKVIHVRSAARVGRSDLGVNRRRLERMRALMDVAA